MIRIQSQILTMRYKVHRPLSTSIAPSSPPSCRHPPLQSYSIIPQCSIWPPAIAPCCFPMGYLDSLPEMFFLHYSLGFLHFFHQNFTSSPPLWEVLSNYPSITTSTPRLGWMICLSSPTAFAFHMHLYLVILSSISFNRLWTYFFNSNHTYKEDKKSKGRPPWKVASYMWYKISIDLALQSWSPCLQSSTVVTNASQWSPDRINIWNVFWITKRRLNLY